MVKSKLDDEFNILKPEEIAESNDLTKALELINKEHVVTEVEALAAKNFVVKANEELKALTPSSLEEKTDIDLDIISNQADQAFTDLMDIALNTGGKACGDISAAAQQFLNIKLQSKLAKTELKLKKMKQELDKKKFEASLSDNSKPDDSDNMTDDGIVIVNN